MDNVVTNIVECMAHFSFERWNESLLLTDIQGCKEILTDPEITSANLAEDKEILFGIGNYCCKAIKGKRSFGKIFFFPSPRQGWRGNQN